MTDAALSIATAPGSGSLRKDVISEIRRRITTGELPADSTFSEGALCDELGFSRAPVREALIVLDQLGWVSAQPRSGYRVASMTLNHLRELFTIRLLLEPKASELAAKYVAGHPESAQAFEAFSDHEDPADHEWRDDHYRYHRRIVIVGQNRELDRILGDVHLKLERYFALDAVRDALRFDPPDHRALTQAILSGDPRAASDAASLHITREQLVVTEAILSSDGITSTPLTSPGLRRGTRQPKGQAS